jgi:outer membrane protein OmpA-like peptidoglycan-associated protein
MLGLLLALMMGMLGAAGTPAAPDTTIVISVPEEGAIRMVYGAPRMRVVPGFRQQQVTAPGVAATVPPAEPPVRVTPRDATAELDELRRLINRRFDWIEAQMGLGDRSLGFILRHFEGPEGPALLVQQPDRPDVPPDTFFLAEEIRPEQLAMLQPPALPRVTIDRPDELPRADIRPPGDPIVIARTRLEEELVAAVRLNFEFDGADLLAHADPTLDAIGDIMQRYQWMRLEIAGHTDNVGAASYNQQLSERRADAARDYLVQRFAIDPGRFETIGYGETQPLLPNRTATERAVNRRVEFRMIEAVPETAEERETEELDDEAIIDSIQEAIREAMREMRPSSPDERREW